MPNSLTTDQLHTLARYGAKARLEELRTEIAAMQAVLSEAPSRGRRTRKAAARPAKVGGARRRKRGKLSAQGRANIIAAQKARWAKLKSEKASTAAGTAADTAPTTKTGRPRKRKSAAKK